MAVLAQDVNLSVLGPAIYSPLVANAADIYYQGSIVWSLAAGKTVVGGMTAGARVIGISTKQQNVAADDIVEVLTFGQVWMPVGSGITAADEGSLLLHDDSDTYTDNPADMKSGTDVTEAANDAAIGMILRVTSTQMLVQIVPGVTGMLYVATAGWGG